MTSQEAANQAISTLNNLDFRGRKLFLELAKSNDPSAEVMADLQNNPPEQVATPADAIAEPFAPQQEAQQAQEVLSLWFLVRPQRGGRE